MKNLFLIILLSATCFSEPLRFADFTDVKKDKNLPDVSPPPTVTLSSGRIVPFGPGVECDTACLTDQSDGVEPKGLPKTWLIGVPVVVGGIMWFLLMPDPPPAAIASSTSRNPLTSGGATAVAEPGTVSLLALGFFGWLARKLKLSRLLSAAKRLWYQICVPSPH